MQGYATRLAEKLLAASALTIVVPCAALAQTNPIPETGQTKPVPASPGATAAPSDAQDDTAADIIVTGSLLRGVAPSGSQVLAVDQAQITATGATQTSELLRTVPQAGTFLNFVGVRGSSNFALTVNRPTLRYLGNSSSSTNSTLVLVDGHRLPGMGVTQTTPDLDAIAPASIERVEIVTDGGSSTYGSDAVGGVINFITRRSFDGLDVKARYGFADKYTEVNASVLAGKKWDGGSAYVSYDYSRHDALYGYDRDWSRNLDYINTQATGSPVGANNQCATANIQIGGATYAYSGLTAGLGNRCDNSEFTTIYPRESKHTVFANVLLDSGGPVSFRMTGFYIHRDNFSDGGPLTASVTVPTTSPYYVTIPGQTGSEVVLTNLSSVLGNSTPQTTVLDSYGITPTLRVDLGKRWQLNVMANYGFGKSTFLGNIVNPTPLAAASAAGAFNPYNLAAAVNATPLAAASNYYAYGSGKNTLMDTRAVIDGPLFHLPAGDVRIAAGAEYTYEKYVGLTNRGTTQAGIATLPEFAATRNVSSVFGEINVPILRNEHGFLHSLTLSASGRYDDYSDFGHTFNPHVGVNFEPVSWITLRGNYNKAFQAPGLSDLALAASNTINVVPLSVRNFADPRTPAGTTNNNYLVLLGGVITPLNPQKAEIYSFGGDIRPPILPGLTLGATYYNIDFKGAISIPPIFTPTVFYTQFPNNYVLYTSGTPALQAYLNQLTALATNPSALSALPNGINSVYGVIDDRSANLSRTITDGIDFYARYRHETSFGAIFGGTSGTYILHFKNQANPNAPVLETVNTETSRLKLTSNVGVDIGSLRAQVTWDYSEGYPTAPTAANLQQNTVASFSVFNLFMQYNVPAKTGPLADLSFTLNIDNIGDTDPPVFRSAAQSLFGVANGFTLGRLVRFGVSKKF